VSTFLVSFGVVAATIAAVVYVVLNSPDQPPTIRPQPSRAKERRSRRAVRRAARPKPAPPLRRPPRSPAPRSPVATPAGPGPGPADSDVMRLRVMPARRTTLWVRIRSSVALVVLVAILGALVALVIGGLLLGVALLVRNATG